MKKIDTTNYQRWLKKDVERRLDLVGNAVANWAQDLVPVNLGTLKKSIHHEVKGNKVDIIAATEYAAAVEEGSKAHWPPPGVMKDWIKKRGLASSEKEIKKLDFLIRRKISKKGTPAQPYLRPAYRNNKRRVMEIFSK